MQDGKTMFFSFSADSSTKITYLVIGNGYGMNTWEYLLIFKSSFALDGNELKCCLSYLKINTIQNDDDKRMNFL